MLLNFLMLKRFLDVVPQRVLKLMKPKDTNQKLNTSRDHRKKIKRKIDCTGNCDCQLKSSYAMEKINVENHAIVFYNQFEADEDMTIKFKFGEKMFMVHRNPNEKLKDTLIRISLNFLKKAKKKDKSKRAKDNSGEAVCTTDDLISNPKFSLLYKDKTKISEETSNKIAWSEAKYLKLCNAEYPVLLNPPCVKSLELVNSPIIGIPIIPMISFQHACYEFSEFSWYRELRHSSEKDKKDDFLTNQVLKMQVESINKNTSKSQSENETDSTEDGFLWEYVGDEKSYTATAKDAGLRIKLKIHPGSAEYPSNLKTENQLHGEINYKPFVNEISVITTDVVRKGPTKCLFDDRLEHTTKRCKSGGFRFVCYNILADVYANSDYAKDFLFPYCPSYAIDIFYRQQFILKELSGYNSDILCLQEVDRWVFEGCLMPSLSLLGYAGAFGAKHQVKEGVALFYKRDKFRLMNAENIILRKSIEDTVLHGDLLQKIKSNTAFFQENLLKRSTCVLICLLQSVEDPTKHILVGNTHLYWHPRAGNIRAIQLQIILKELHLRLNKLKSESNEANLSRTYTTMLCGDMNSSKHTAVVDLMTKGQVAKNHSDFFSGGKQEHINGLELKSDIKYSSACGFPEYTNYVTGFCQCLDYIFYDEKHLNVDRVIPQPDHAEVIKETALPNPTAPSDHIAQVVDLRWNDFNMQVES